MLFCVLDRFAFLLLVMVSSLGKIIESKVSSISHRPYSNFSQMDILSCIFPGQ